MTEKRMIGTVSAFSYRGFGWISVPTLPDFYLHVSQVRDRINPAVGQMVSFDPGPPKRGKSAEALNVQFLIDPTTIQDGIDDEQQDQIVNKE
jgi:cold shock CspA family protein